MPNKLKQSHQGLHEASSQRLAAESFVKRIFFPHEATGQVSELREPCA